jgi:hypothetical protein
MLLNAKRLGLAAAVRRPVAISIAMSRIVEGVEFNAASVSIAFQVPVNVFLEAIVRDAAAAIRAKPARQSLSAG